MPKNTNIPGDYFKEQAEVSYATQAEATHSLSERATKQIGIAALGVASLIAMGATATYVYGETNSPQLIGDLPPVEQFCSQEPDAATATASIIATQQQLCEAMHRSVSSLIYTVRNGQQAALSHQTADEDKCTMFDPVLDYVSIKVAAADNKEDIVCAEFASNEYGRAEAWNIRQITVGDAETAMPTYRAQIIADNPRPDGAPFYGFVGSIDGGEKRGTFIDTMPERNTDAGNYTITAETIKRLHAAIG